MKFKNKIGYKLHCLINRLWRKTDLKVFEYLNSYFAKWWIEDYLRSNKKWHNYFGKLRP